MERWSRWQFLAVLSGWLVLASAPFLVDSAGQRILTRILIFGLLALSLNLLLGNTGIVSFGHGLFFGAGSYTLSLLFLHKGTSAIVAIALAPLIAALFAAVGGLVAFRAKRLYFGLLTLAVSQAGFVIASQAYSLTQGENGIHGVALPDWLTATPDKYWFVLGVFTVAVTAIRVLVGSPFGTTLRAIRENRDRVAFLGINAVRYEYAAFVISAAFAGLAGALLVVLDQNSFPMLFHWTTSAEPLLMIVIGGASSFFGPLLGAAVVVYLRDYLGGVTSHINLLYGIAVLVIALGAPGGLAGLLRSGVSALSRAARGRRGGDPDREPRRDSPHRPTQEELSVTRGAR